MKFKKIAIVLIIAIVVISGANYVLKEYIFPFRHRELILKYSKENNLDPYLVLSVIMAESKFNPEAKSHKDAKGLMQITDNTGRWIAEQMDLVEYSEDKLYQEEYNIKMGCWYLNNLYEEFGDKDLCIAAYNAGRGRVNEWLNNKEYSRDGRSLDYIPYKETKKYVDKVNTYYKIYKKIYENRDP